VLKTSTVLLRRNNMFLNKKIGRTKVTFRTNNLVNLTLVNVSLDRFYGRLFKLTLLNISLIIHYVSEKQEKAWVSFMTAMGGDDGF
jgi:hypothetical protein